MPRPSRLVAEGGAFWRWVRGKWQRTLPKSRPCARMGGETDTTGERSGATDTNSRRSGMSSATDSAQTDLATASAAPAAQSARPTLVLVDGHAMYHRSFHAFPEEIATSAGEPTNAVFGFTRMLLDVLRIIRPDYLAMTFDRSAPTFRHRAFAPYKAHRPPLPDALRAQWPRTREVVAAFNMPVFEV